VTWSADRPLTGKVAVITGADDDLGAAVATRFAEAGAHVAASAADRDAVDDTLDAIEEAGGRAVAFSADLGRPADRAALVEATLGRFGRLDILVNNASATHFEPATRMADSRVDAMLEVTVRAPLDLARRVLPGMRGRRSGWILNVTSEAARHPDGPPYPTWAVTAGVFGACTAALERLTTALAAECVDDYVAVNALAARSAQLDGFDPTAPPDLASIAEFAEAALTLCGGGPDFRTGHITTASALLRLLGTDLGGE
jgi:citronellol/citronellal dehydrogenase